MICSPFGVGEGFRSSCASSARNSSLRRSLLQRLSARFPVCDVAAIFDAPMMRSFAIADRENVKEMAILRPSLTPGPSRVLDPSPCRSRASTSNPLRALWRIIRLIAGDGLRCRVAKSPRPSVPGEMVPSRVLLPIASRSRQRLPQSRLRHLGPPALGDVGKLQTAHVPFFHALNLRTLEHPVGEFQQS